MACQDPSRASRLPGLGMLARLCDSRFLPFAIATAAFLASNHFYRNEGLQYDSMYYWALGHLYFLEDGHFSFLNFGAPIRGYLFPLILGCISKLSSLLSVDGLLLYRTLAALFFGCLVSTLAPAAFHKAAGRRPSTVQVLIFSGLVFLFWRGYAAYSLSDFPAIACLIGAYILFPFSEDIVGLNWLRTPLAGFLLAAAAIIRPSYQIVLILLAITIILKSVSRPKSITKHAVIRLSATLIGIAAAFAPQLVLNAVHNGTYSPLTPSGGLYAQQLTWGIRMQRYDTNIGETYPSPKVMFIDPVGDAICKRENLDVNKPLTYGEYLAMIGSYPLDLAAIYGRHLFNGLDVTYSTPYVKNVLKRNVAFSFVNYFLIFAAIVFLAETRSGWRAHRVTFGYCLVFVSPAILSLPGAVETRFFLPVHLLVYTVVSFGLSAEYLRDHGTTLLRRYWLVALLFILFCFVLSSLTFSTLQHGTVLLNVL